LNWIPERSQLRRDFFGEVTDGAWLWLSSRATDKGFAEEPDPDFLCAWVTRRLRLNGPLCPFPPPRNVERLLRLRCVGAAAVPGGEDI